MFEQISAGEAVSLPVIIKADVHGSLEAIIEMLTQQETEPTQFNNRRRRSVQ